MVKTAVIVGNCQAFPLWKILKSSERFSANFDLYRFPPVHVAKPSDIEELAQRLRQTDLLIAQSISENYRGGGLGTKTLSNHLKPNGLCISWPSIFWDGYNPELFYLKDAHGKSVSIDFDYHLRPILRDYIAGKDPEQTCHDLFVRTCTETPNAIDIGLSSLKARESNLDIRVSDFIERNFRSTRLFWTFNHPSNAVLIEAASQIMSVLGFQNDLPSLFENEFLASTRYPVLPQTRTALQLEFDESTSVSIRGEEVSALDAILRYHDFYMRHPELVELNKGLVC